VPTHEDEVLDVAGTPIQSRARSFDREEMLCTVCNIADAPSCHVRTNICQAQARSATYSRSTTPDNVGPVTCAVTRYDRKDIADREDIADRKDIADREDYQGVTDRADVPDREIEKILPIGKMLPIGNILPIDKMIVLFIFRSNFQ
jgi:hypothetical protein